MRVIETIQYWGTDWSVELEAFSVESVPISCGILTFDVYYDKNLSILTL